MGLMFIIANAYITNHNLDHVEIVDLLTIGYSETPRGWWEKYHSEDSRKSIKKAVKKNGDGLPIFDERICQGILGSIYTIIKYFVGIPNISLCISDYLKNLHCPTMFDNRWYQDVFISRVMLQKDCLKPYWKEKFITSLPLQFAQKVKEELTNKNGTIKYDELTYGDIFSII